MLGELELANLLDSNRRSDMPGRGNRLPATHARGHSSPNQDGSGSSSDNLAYLTVIPYLHCGWARRKTGKIIPIYACPAAGGTKSLKLFPVQFWPLWCTGTSMNLFCLPDPLVFLPLDQEDHLQWTESEITSKFTYINPSVFDITYQWK